MTPTSATNSIEVLLARVESATGPDREIDAEIVKAFCPDATVGTYIVGDGGDIVFHAKELGIADKLPVPAYTASIDQALGLVERVLPGSWVDMSATKDRGSAKVCFEGNVAYWSDTCPNLPLAIVQAALRALIAQGQKP